MAVSDMYSVHTGKRGLPQQMQPGPMAAPPRPKGGFGGGAFAMPQYEQKGPGLRDKIAMASGMLRDYDGTMGSGNYAQAKGEYDQRAAQEMAAFEQQQQQQLMQAAAAGDPRALFMLSPQLAISQQNRGEDMTRDDARYADTRQDRAQDVGFRDRSYQDTRTDRTEDVGFRDKQFDYGVQNDQRNYGRGVMESDRSYNLAADSAAMERERFLAESGGEFMGTGQQGDYPPSPFDNMGTYRGGHLIEARYDGPDFGSQGGGEQPQGDFAQMSPFGRRPTDFDKTQDKEVAKDIAEWKTSGQANAQTNLTRLQSVIATLRDPNKNTTGPMIGGMPGRKVFAPGSVDAQQTAEAAVQGSLKAILGGQFAQAEAEALFNRTYDPQLSEEVNAQRLELLYNDLVNRARINEGLARYADQYGTTQGFKVYLPGLQDFGQENANQTTGAGPGPGAGATDNIPTITDPSQLSGLQDGQKWRAPDGSIKIYKAPKTGAW